MYKRKRLKNVEHGFGTGTIKVVLNQNSKKKAKQTSDREIEEAEWCGRARRIYTSSQRRRVAATTRPLWNYIQF